MTNPKKVLSKSFVDNNEAVNEDEAFEGIVKATQKIREIEDEKSADESLASARQIVKDLNSAYSSAVKYEKAKINFFLQKIAEIQEGTVNPNSAVNK